VRLGGLSLPVSHPHTARSVTDREADQASDRECDAKTRRVDERNEARSGLGDLERADRAGAQAHPVIQLVTPQRESPRQTRACTTQTPAGKTTPCDVACPLK
jgi:hypothetical protein